MHTNEAGFSLVELLAAAAIAGLMLAGGVGLFAAHHQTYTTEGSRVGMEENLRVAMTVLADAVRGAGDGVPASNLATWIPWYGGFGADPIAVSTAPPSVTVARCLAHTVAVLASPGTAGETTLELSSALSGSAVSDLLDADAKRLVLIDEREHAHITAVSGNRITIDTDPLRANAQGLDRAYPTGTPLCRVDVLTFFVETSTTTGRPELRVNMHRGDDDETVAEGITELQLTTLTAGKAYEIGLAADAELHDRSSGASLTGSLRTQVTLRN